MMDAISPAVLTIHLLLMVNTLQACAGFQLMTSIWNSAPLYPDKSVSLLYNGEIYPRVVRSLQRVITLIHGQMVRLYVTYTMNMVPNFFHILTECFLTLGCKATIFIFGTRFLWRKASLFFPYYQTTMALFSSRSKLFKVFITLLISKSQAIWDFSTFSGYQNHLLF